MSQIDPSPTNHENFIHTLKEDYSKRIDEVDAFSKRLTNMCVEVNTEFLYGCLDVAQHYLDAQKKCSGQYPMMYSPDFMTGVIKKNTEAWIQAVQNIDTVCIDSMKNMKNNLRSLNRNAVLFVQNAERITDGDKNFQLDSRSESKAINQQNSLELISSNKSNRS